MTIDLRGPRKFYLLVLVLLVAALLQGSGFTAPQAAQAAPSEPVSPQLLTHANAVTKAVVPVVESGAKVDVGAVAPATVPAEGEPDCRVCQPTGLPLVVAGNDPVYVTCRFRDPHQPQHGGLDFPADKYTEVRATHDGTIVQASYDEIYGNLVVIENPQWKSRYAHHAYLLVRAGDTVQAGDVIGLVGSTGDSSGAHLHYEVRDALNNARDPEKYLDGTQLRFAPCTHEEKE